ncbi:MULTISPECIES: type II toxin-antitoxin system RelE/ParE family toxin [Pandoraea]|uniref:type II toxin-antitoxin system RelE/ParE family toxin n=1 Tax=Pandoraea TaxID=93217 RepID=UPI000B3F9731|nr:MULTISPECIES: type II toxin-antitoxin system RelE/ParE family toxin [Pandoraea]VVE53451.1 addiction module toxin RelE [Pandoraea iniqua]
MIPIFWTRRAIRERLDALHYLLLRNARAAQSQSKEISKQVSVLHRFPAIGRPGEAPGTRELVIRRTPFHTVYQYRSELPRVEIARLLHNARHGR